uniref:Uncharacterized protein n=1 Tax=Zooxanthella nutricula TaxID=1333877 RepID=A0A6U9X1A9_9DINO
MLAERPCRLEIVRRRLESVKRMVEVAGGIAVEAWKESQKADDRKQQQAMAEKTAVEQQLADALRQIEELKSMQRECLEKAAETEQKLIDTETEKLQVEVDRDRAEEANRALQEKVEEAKQACLEEKGNVDEFQKREEASKAEKEELMQQVGVLTEECEAHKQEAEDLVEQLATKEEELMNTNMGYCNLSDQMGDMREEFDEKARQLECVNETLSQRNAELLDEGIALRKEVHEWRHKVTDAEKAITRAQQGMPLAYSFLFVTPLAPETPNGAKAAEQAPREEKKRKKKSKYDEDFDEDLE